jgi:hypothetical protein
MPKPVPVQDLRLEVVVSMLKKYLTKKQFEVIMMA